MTRMRSLLAAAALCQLLGGPVHSQLLFVGLEDASLAWLFLTVVLVAPWFVHPSHVARTAETWAGALEREEMRVAPLLLARGAMWVEPGEPKHALHALRLHDALGQVRQARSLREDLRRRWEMVAPAISLTEEPSRGLDGGKGAAPSSSSSPMIEDPPIPPTP